MKLLTLTALFFNAFCPPEQSPIDVTDQTLKVGGMKTEEMYFGFAGGDKIIFNFTEANGKELKEVEIVEYPSSSKFSDFKTTKIDNKVVYVTSTGIYKFRFYNSTLSGRICKIRIQRVPAGEETVNFNTTVSWVDRQDTVWNTYTKDVVAGYDTIHLQKKKKELVKCDTGVVELFNKTERVHSETAFGKSQYAYLDVNLPQNKYTPHIFNPYFSSEVIAWSYWIGVGQRALEDYKRTNDGLSEGLSTLGHLSGYGALAKLAITGISMFGTPSVGDNVGYKFISVQQGEKKVFDFGNGIAASGRHDRLLQGAFTIQLFNDNFRDGIDVTVKMVAVQLIKTWEDKAYTETKVTARYEKKIFKDPVISTTKVPVLR